MRFLLLAALLVGEARAADIDTREYSGVVFDVATPGQEYASITWRSDAVQGRRLLGFTTSPDGARHTYWFDFTNRHNTKHKHTGEKSWTGTVHAFTVEQVLSGKKLTVENMRLVSGRPSLPPDIGVTYAGPESAIPRAGRPLALELILRNYGTEPARNVRFSFDGLPTGCRVLNEADLAPSGEIGACEGWDSVDDDWESGRLPNERRFRVTLSDPSAGRHVFGLAVSADGMTPRRVSVTAELLPPLGLPKADRMPAPRPVKTGKYEIGAFIFPGWDTHLWHGVWSRAPHRKPVLGWYDETDPEVIDWQIKHLVENGVSFVFVDWYWSRGHHYHRHWPVAFGKARYRGMLKWSLMWANHNAPGAHSVADQEKVTRYWIDNYFRDPQYMQIDGKPVVSIWSADAMERDMGPGGCRKLLDVSRRIAVEAGLGGIHFIAVRSQGGNTDREYLAKYETYGFDGTCTYKYVDYGDPKAPPRVDGFQEYGYLADSSLRHWRELQENSDLPFLPSLTTAYDDRPWRGEMSSPVKNVNAADFRRICADARRFADETGVTRLLLGPLDEWGEGSIGYPNREHGFGMLEAVRDTFGEKPGDGWPLNYAPEDVGLGPYARADDPLCHAARRVNGVVEDMQSPVRIVRTARSTTLFDFGKAAFGGVEVDFAEGEYEVRIGEKLDAQGCVDMKPGGTIRAAAVRGASRGSGFERIPLVADRRNTKGVNRKTHAYPIPEKFGVVMPFRYVEVVSAPSDVAAANVRRTVLHWPIDMAASSFKCSDERLEKVYEFCKYSIWATSFAGVYVDGDRERIPYEADAYINQMGHYAVDADFEMGRRTFDFLMDHPTWPTEWAQHMIMMAWSDWMYSGSTNLIAKYYARLKGEKLLLNLAREDGLLVSFPDHSTADQGDIVDWPVGERDGFVFKPVNAVVNAFHYRNLREMRDIADALGKRDDAAFYGARAEKVRKSFDKAFYRRDTGLYADGEGTDHASLHANAAALAFGLVPEERTACVADFLVSKGMACSVYFAQYLLEALFKAGRGDAAIALMTADGDRSWLGMMAQGSTVAMEAWSLGAKPNQDWNHAWGTAPLNVISRYVLGVTPTSPGFKTYEVRPASVRVKASGIVPTVRGPIVVGP